MDEGERGWIVAMLLVAQAAMSAGVSEKGLKLVCWASRYRK